MRAGGGTKGQGFLGSSTFLAPPAPRPHNPSPERLGLWPKLTQRKRRSRLEGRGALPQAGQLETSHWVTQGDRGLSWPPPLSCIIYNTRSLELSNSCSTAPPGGTCHSGMEETRCLLREGPQGPWRPPQLARAGAEVGTGLLLHPSPPWPLSPPLLQAGGDRITSA